jgi:hypothetical protein
MSPEVQLPEADPVMLAFAIAIVGAVNTFPEPPNVTGCDTVILQSVNDVPFIVNFHPDLIVPFFIVKAALTVINSVAVSNALSVPTLIANCPVT